MADLTAQRTLVKSTPELWSELSEVESLAKHLGELGEIRITKVEPETTVAWEGEQISGTVELEQSGWGTRVTFRATVPEPDPLPDPEATQLPPCEPPHDQGEPAPAASEPVLEATPVRPEPERAPIQVELELVPAPQPEPEPRRERGNFITRWLFRERRAARTAAIEARAAVTESEPMEESVTVEFEPVAFEPGPVPAVVEPEPVAVEPEPVTVAAEPAPAAPESPEIERVRQVLDGTLEALGQAHHRPFSRG
jgi:hypothetical protein